MIAVHSDLLMPSCTVNTFVNFILLEAKDKKFDIGSIIITDKHQVALNEAWHFNAETLN